MASQAIKGVWRPLSSFLSSEIITRSSHSVNYFANKIFIYGGEHDPRIPISNNFFVYDLKESKWSKIENIGDQKPCSRVGHTSCVLSNKIYIFGGRVGVGMGEGSLSDLYEFDTLTYNWKLLDDGKSKNAPISRSYHAMTSLSDRLFVFGGCSEGRLNDFYCFDLIKNEWNRLPQDDRISPRGGSAICSYKSNTDGQEYVYVIGGFNGKEIDDCFVYNVQNSTWSQIASLPKGLSVFASAIVNDNKEFRLIVHGGEIGPSNEGHKSAGEFSSDTLLFDGEKWIKVESQNAPIPRAWHAGTYGDGNFYIYGGMLENSDRIAELFSLEFNQNN
jgi:N-acetylneuraminic acid mutarotase